VRTHTLLFSFFLLNPPLRSLLSRVCMCRRWVFVALHVATCTVWLRLGEVCAAALAHAVVCRRRAMNQNPISTIASGAFAGLTALRFLYDVGLWAGRSLMLAAWCLHVSEALRGLFQAHFSLHFSYCLVPFSHSHLHMPTHSLFKTIASFPFCFFKRLVCVVCVCV
jgi:hypothetical protein